MNWDLLDLAVFSAMLASAGGIVALALMKSRDLAYRAGAVLATGTAFVLVWANLAVGIIGEPSDDANVLYYATLIVALTGVIIARAQARGTAYAMFATAAAQGLAAMLALALGFGIDSPSWPMVPLLASAFFAMPFATAGWLFLQSAKGGALAA